MAIDEKKKSKKDRKDRIEKKRRRSAIKEQPESPSKSTSTSTDTSKVKPKVRTIKSDTDVKINTNFKRVKFDNDTTASSKCLTLPTKFSTKIRVQVEEPDSNKNPIVVSFPAGLPSSLTTDDTNNHNDQDDDDDNTSPPPLFTWTKARTSSSKGRSLHGADDTCTFTSANMGRGHDNRLTKLYVAIYHKPSKTIKFIPSAERGHVFAMEQKVSSYVQSKEIDFRSMTSMQRRRMVFESFGSSKKKKVLKSQDANVVKMESVFGAGDGMMNALKKQMSGDGLVSESNRKVMEDLSKSDGTDIKPSTAVERAYAEARRAFLPPFDENAEHEFEIYDSQEVAGDDAWEQMKRNVHGCTKNDNPDWKEAFQQKGKWPESVKALLDTVPHPKEKGMKYNLKTILLVKHLVHFHSRATKAFMDGTPEDIATQLRLPIELSNRFLELFCVPTFHKGRAGYATTKQQKDKRVVYTLIMYLMAHGRVMMVGSIGQLCADMKLEVRDAINLYREAGCKCVKKGRSGIVSVSLKAPLTFPPPKKGKKT